MKLKWHHLLGAAVLATGMTTLGCPTKERAPDAERTTTSGGSLADDLLLNLSEHLDGVVTVTTGTEHFAKGLVTLSVHGGGRIEIVNRRSGKTIKHEGKLTPAEVAQLGTSFSKAGFTTCTTSGPPRTPGDTPVVLEIRRGSKRLFQRELWHGDRYQQPGLDEILERSDAIVSDTTDGELPY